MSKLWREKDLMELPLVVRASSHRVLGPLRSFGLSICLFLQDQIFRNLLNTMGKKYTRRTGHRCAESHLRRPEMNSIYHSVHFYYAPLLQHLMAKNSTFWMHVMPPSRSSCKPGADLAWEIFNPCRSWGEMWFSWCSQSKHSHHKSEFLYCLVFNISKAFHLLYRY